MSTSLVSEDVDRILVVTEVSIGYLTAAVIAYYLSVYYQNRTQTPILKRFYPLVLSIGILSLLLLCIQMPVIQLTNFGALNQLDPSIIPHDFGTIPDIVFDVFFGYIPIFTLHGVLYLMLIRLFLICFHIKFSVISKTSNVLQYINDSKLPRHRQYAVNKSKYGNIRGALRLFAVPYLVSSAIACSVYGVFGGYQWQFETVNPILLCIPLAVSQLIWVKTPKFNDYFKIRKEVLGASIGGVIGIICYAAASIGYVVLAAYSIDGLVLQRLSCLILIALLGHTNLFMTMWVLRNSGRHALDTQHAMNRMNRSIDHEVDQTAYKRMETLQAIGCCGCCRRIHPLSHCELLLDISFDADASRTDSKRTKLIDVLSDREGFDLFVVHLLKEFSTENVLAVVELTQYRTYYQDVDWGLDYLLRDRPKQSQSLRMSNGGNRLIQIPEHVPRSEVIHDDELEMVDKVRYLVEKYIVEGARFQVNISGIQRQETMDKYQQLILGTMLEMEGQYIFDSVRSSIMVLMGDSLRRFETTKEYKMLKSKLKY